MKFFGQISFGYGFSHLQVTLAAFINHFGAASFLPGSPLIARSFSDPLPLVHVLSTVKQFNYFRAG